MLYFLFQMSDIGKGMAELANSIIALLLHIITFTFNISKLMLKLFILLFKLRDVGIFSHGLPRVASS